MRQNVVTLKLLATAFLVALSSLSDGSWQPRSPNKLTGKVPRIDSLSLRFQRSQFSAGLCQLNSPVDSSFCVVCSQGYYAREGQCMKQRVEGCAEYVLNKNACKRWVPESRQARILQSNTINQCVLQRNNKCKECNNLWYVNSLKTCSPITSQFCSFSDGKSNACITCVSAAYALTAAGQCLLGTVTNCAAYDSLSTKCKKCNNLFYPNSSSQCSPITSSNCLQSSGFDNKCQQCKNLFFINSSDNCSPITNQANCQSSNGVSNYYLGCINSGFIRLQSGSCVQGSVSNCAGYQVVRYENGSSSGSSGSGSNGDHYVCIVCNNLYYLTANQLCSHIAAANCAVSNGIANACQECSPSYTLTNPSTCTLIITIPHCLTYNSDHTSCTQCDSTQYFVDSLGKCTLFSDSNCDTQVPYEDKCSVCKSGYYPNAQFKCVTTTDNCSSSGGVYDVCIHCQFPNQILDSNNRCVVRTTVSHCAEYTDYSADCVKCESLFYPSLPSNCQSVALPCLESDGLSQDCTKCQRETTYLSGSPKTCVQGNIANCAEYALNANTCNRCSPGWSLPTSAACVEIPGCIASDGVSSVCTDCTTGFTLSGGVCSPSIGGNQRYYLKAIQNNVVYYLYKDSSDLVSVYINSNNAPTFSLESDLQLLPRDKLIVSKEDSQTPGFINIFISDSIQTGTSNSLSQRFDLKFDQNNDLIWSQTFYEIADLGTDLTNLTFYLASFNSYFLFDLKNDQTDIIYTASASSTSTAVFSLELVPSR